MIKILLVILLIVISLATADDQCEKDIKALYPIALKWINFTTEFEKHYFTKISVITNSNPFVIGYQIFNFDNKNIYSDVINLPMDIGRKKNIKIPVIIGSASFFCGILSGIFICIQIEKLK